MKMRKQNIDKKRLCLLVVLIIISIMNGCKNQTDEEPDSSSVPEIYMITKENYFDYQSGMECSAFASAYLLRSFGEDAEGMDLFEDYPNKAPDGGIMPSGIEIFFKERGYQAEYVCDGTLNELKAQVALGSPVIVFIHVSESAASVHNTHYVPVVGYDEDYLYLAESIRSLADCIDEPGIAYNRRIENAQFMRLWENIDGIWDYPYFKISK